MLMKKRGYGLIEAMMVSVMSTVIILGGVKSYQMFTETKELDDRSVITAQQIAQFSEASYLYATQKGDMTDEIITVEELNDNGFLVDTFPEKTPYGQEIKGFLVENEDDSSMNDILVATTGKPDDAMINKTGQSAESYNKNQMKTYYSIRRELLSVDNSYSMGLIENNTFSTENDLIVRDISRFGATIDNTYKQVGIYMTSPEAISPDSDVVVEIRAIGAYPEEDVPANGSSESIVSISVRDSNGNPVDNSRIEWTAPSSSAVLSSAFSYTNSEGVATVRVTNTVEEIAKVIGRSVDAGETESVDITFVGYDVSSVTASEYSDVETYYVNNSSVVCNYLTGTLQYPDGSPAENVLVRWTSTNGERLYMDGSIITSKTERTDSNGVSQICIKSQDGGTFEMEMVADNGASGAVDVEYIDFKVLSYELSTESLQKGDSLEIDMVIGYETGKVMSNVNAISRVYYEGETISRSASSKTNSLGEATTRYTNMPDGTHRVTLEASGGSPEKIEFTIDVDGPKIVNIWANKVKSNDYANVYVIVGYDDGTVSQGEKVDFSANGGYLSSSSRTTNSAGDVNVRFTANTPPSNGDGFYTVYATHNGSTRYVQLRGMDFSDTRYDSNNMVTGRGEACDPPAPNKYSIKWDGNVVGTGFYNAGTPTSVSIGGYTYSWGTSYESFNQYREAGPPAPCGGRWGVTVVTYEITRTKN